MKIPEGTKEGFYWVKLPNQPEWCPAYIWKGPQYGEHTVREWQFDVAGFHGTSSEKDIEEFGQRIEHSSESIGEISRSDHGEDPECITIAPDDWIKVDDWVDPDDGEVRICGARYAKMKECERIVESLQALVSKSMQVSVEYAEEYAIDKRNGWALAVNGSVIIQFADELGDLFVEEK